MDWAIQSDKRKSRTIPISLTSVHVVLITPKKGVFIYLPAETTPRWLQAASATEAGEVPCSANEASPVKCETVETGEASFEMRC